MPPSGGTTRDENNSPPPEGCRGGLWRTGGPTPKAGAFCPSQEGIFTGVIHATRWWHHRGMKIEFSPPLKGCRGCPLVCHNKRHPPAACAAAPLIRGIYRGG